MVNTKYISNASTEESEALTLTSMAYQTIDSLDMNKKSINALI